MYSNTCFSNCPGHKQMKCFRLENCCWSIVSSYIHVHIHIQSLAYLQNFRPCSGLPSTLHNMIFQDLHCTVCEALTIFFGLFVNVCWLWTDTSKLVTLWSSVLGLILIVVLDHWLFFISNDLFKQLMQMHVKWGTSVEENANPSAKVVGTRSTISFLAITVVLQNRRSSHTNNDWKRTDAQAPRVL